jgi:hypothetical protein
VQYKQIHQFSSLKILETLEKLSYYIFQINKHLLVEKNEFRIKCPSNVQGQKEAE